MRAPCLLQKDSPQRDSPRRNGAIVAVDQGVVNLTGRCWRRAAAFKAAAPARGRLQLFQKLDQRLLICRRESPKPPEDLACLTAVGLRISDISSASGGVVKIFRANGRCRSCRSGSIEYVALPIAWRHRTATPKS